MLHRGRVKLAVGLGARTTDRGPLSPVEDAKLNAAAVGNAAHQSVERVDLANEVALPQASDRWIAGHRSDGIEPMRDKRRARAHARGCGYGLAAGVSPADHDDIVARIHATKILKDFSLSNLGSEVKNCANKYRCFT